MQVLIVLSAIINREFGYFPLFYLLFFAPILLSKLVCPIKYSGKSYRCWLQTANVVYLILYFFWLLFFCWFLLFELCLIAVITLYIFFLCGLQVVVLRYQRCLQSWRVLCLLLMIKIVCLCYRWGVKPYASSLVFLFTGTFLEVLPSSTSKIVPRILQERQPRFLPIWWDFYFIVWKYFLFLLYNHHHVVLVARISLTLSRHFSLSFIASGRSSGQHHVSSHSCWMYVRAGRPAFVRPCVGVHKCTSLMSSSLLLQQCPACLVRLTWILFVIGGRWPYSWCLVGRCCQDLFKIARSILV